MSASAATHGPVTASEPLPPVAYTGVVALSLLFVGGIYLASYLPHQPSLVPAVVLLVLATLLVVWSLVALARSRGFAWPTFWLVARWVGLAYLVIGAMFEYMFVRSGTRGAPLVVMTLMIAAFVVTVTLLVAFTVARNDRTRG